MTLDERFVVGINLGEVFRDKDSGEPLANGTIEFYRDNNRTAGKNVYQLTGDAPNYTYTPLVNPVSLSSVGTIQNSSGDNIALYFYPYVGTPDENNTTIDNYYVVVKDSGGTVQFTREAWPNITQGNDPQNDTAGKVTNELSNSQFVDVFFTGSYTFQIPSGQTSASFELGPDWVLAIEGTALSTVAVQRVSLAGNLGAPDNPDGAELANPAYALETIPSAGISTVTLRQRLNNNPGIFSGGYISGYLVAKSETTNNTTVVMQYQESGGLAAQDIVSSNEVKNSGYTELRGSVLFPDSTNTQTSDVGYLDILVSLPANDTTRVSAIQVVGMDQDQTAAAYDQQPVNRQQDFTWHHYKESVIIYPKKSILTGWQFGVNPWQYFTTTVGSISTPMVGTYYAARTADQTYLVNEHDTMLQIGRSTGDDNGSYLIQKDGATQGRFALVQYIHLDTMRPYWGNKMAVALRSLMSNSVTDATNIKYRVDLIFRTDAPPAINPIAGFGDTTAKNTYTAGWTTVPQDIAEVKTFPTSTKSGYTNGYDVHTFNNFNLPVASSGGYLGIVVYSVEGKFAANDVLRIQDISLVPDEYGQVATPETFTESLAKCEFYYCKSFAQGTVPAQNAGLANATFSVLTTGAANEFIGDIKFAHPMCKVPTIASYNPSANNALARNVTAGSDFNTTVATNVGKSGFHFIGTPSSGVLGNITAVHWVAVAWL